AAGASGVAVVARGRPYAAETVLTAGEYGPEPMRARLGIALGAGVLLLAATRGLAEGAAASWSIGAAKVGTTPPRFSAAQDLKDFPEVDPARQTTCPRSTYNGPRRWRFEEPYQDSDHSGDFDYADPQNPSSTGDQY